MLRSSLNEEPPEGMREGSVRRQDNWLLGNELRAAFRPQGSVDHYSRTRFIKSAIIIL